MFDPKLKEALSRVQKPGRYTGGEPGSVYKNKDEVDVRFAFCFPDTYEVGMPDTLPMKSEKNLPLTQISPSSRTSAFIFFSMEISPS